MDGHFLDTIDIIVIVNTVVCITIGFTIEHIVRLKQEITDLRIRLLANQREQAVRFQLIIDHIKQQADKPQALDDFQHLFENKLSKLRHAYPALTDSDAQVLLLIGLGIPNHEIIAFTNLSKRTYYKRRQLIAKHMNTTAAQLDELVRQFFTSNK